MKKIILLFILSTFSQLGFSQYVHFPDSNAVWSVWQQKFFVNGDSLYNNNSYKKYYISTSQTLANPTFFALLREDTITKKIYSINSAGQEKLLYDFSLNLNDTVTVFPKQYWWADSLKVKVEAIDSIVTFGQYRKRLKVIGVDMFSSIEEYWIEGIGSTMGLFYPGHTAFIIFDVAYPTLLCFENESNLLYQNPAYNSCYQSIPTGINDLWSNKEVRIFPNPSSEIIYFTNIESKANISIYNNLGQLQLTKLYQNNEGIDVSNLAKGLYFYTISSAQNNSSGKFVKE